MRERLCECPAKCRITDGLRQLVNFTGGLFYPEISENRSIQQTNGKRITAECSLQRTVLTIVKLKLIIRKGNFQTISLFIKQFDGGLSFVSHICLSKRHVIADEYTR